MRGGEMRGGGAGGREGGLAEFGKHDHTGAQAEASSALPRGGAPPVPPQTMPNINLVTSPCQTRCAVACLAPEEGLRGRSRAHAF